MLPRVGTTEASISSSVSESTGKPTEIAMRASISRGGDSLERSEMRRRRRGRERESVSRREEEERVAE